MAHLEINKMWALSTAHLRESTCNWLDKRGNYPKGEYGWFVYVSEDYVPGTPNELKVIFAKARELGVSWIEFDCDAPIVDDLVIFDW